MANSRSEAIESAQDRAQMLSHEQIVNRFLRSKAVDFNALGRFVAEHGESIVISGRGDYGVRFGHYNILACFKMVHHVVDRGDILGSGIASDVLGG